MKFDIFGVEYSSEIYDNKGIGTNYYMGSDLIFTSKHWWSTQEDRKFLKDWHCASNHIRTENGFLRPFGFVEDDMTYSGNPLNLR